MSNIVGPFLLLLSAGILAESAPLSLAPGKLDDLSSDRGWVSSDREPPQSGVKEEIRFDPKTPEALAASIYAAQAKERLEQQPRGLFLEKQNKRLRLDNLGSGRRFVGTSEFKAFDGNFIFEFELTAALMGAKPITFGLSDQANALNKAENALYLEYGVYTYRKPMLRWLLRSGGSFTELGRLPDIGWASDKLIRISRKGKKLRLEVQQDYVLEQVLEAESKTVVTLNWIGSAYSRSVSSKSGQRTVAYIDNIRGLDADGAAEPSPKPAGEGKALRRIGKLDLLRGKPRRLVVRDGFAYLAHGDGGPDSHLVILDVSRPGEPVVVSKLGLNWWPFDIEVAEDIAFVPDGMVLHLVDVGDPKSPSILGRYEKDLGMNKGEARCVAVHEGTVYLAAAKLGMLALDITIADSPALLGTAHMPQLRQPHDLEVRGNYVWMASDGGLHIFDVTNPRRPKRLRSSSAQKQPKKRDDDLDLGLGLGLGTNGDESTVKKINLKEYELARHPIRLALEEEYLYVVDRKAGLLVFDVSDPANPESMGVYKPNRGKKVKGVEVYATSVVVREQTAFLTVNHGYVPQKLENEDKTAYMDAGGGLHVVNVADPLDPVFMGRFTDEKVFTNYVDVALAGTNAFVSDANYGVWSINVSDERQPRLLGGTPTQGEVRDVFIEGNTAYLASGFGQGVFAVDISEPKAPKVIGHHHTGFDIQSLAVYQGLVYTGCPSWSLPHGLQVIDFREPARPELKRTVAAAAAIQWITAGDLLYASSGEVFDLRDPYFPDPYGKLPSGSLLKDGGQFFIARPNTLFGLMVINPRSQSPVQSRLRLLLDTAGRTNLARSGDALFVVAGEKGVAVVDIKDSRKLKLIKMLKGNIGSAVDVSAAGRFVCITDLYQGIKLYDAAGESRPRLLAVYPDRDEQVLSTGYRSVFHKGLLYRSRLNGLDVLEAVGPKKEP